LNRECTSFAYWYFANVEGNSGLSVNGNAGWWWETSNYPAITYSSAVKVGAIGVEPSVATSTSEVPSLHDSTTGHVMIVMALPGESYNGVNVPSNYVMVASMNEDEAGHFLYDLWPSADLWYINPN
jgi:surface antigen